MLKANVLIKPNPATTVTFKYIDIKEENRGAECSYKDNVCDEEHRGSPIQH